MPNFFTTRNLIIAVAALLLAGGGLVWYLTLPKGAGEERKSAAEFFYGLFPGGGESQLTEEEQKRLEEAEREGILPPETPAQRGESFQLVPEAVSGATIVKGRVRYIEKSSGHVFEMDFDGGNKQRISNTTIPGIFEVVWSGTGGRAILKYLSGEKLNILSANFTGSSTQGSFLSPDIKDALFSLKGDRIAYVIEAPDETLVITAAPDNKNQTVRLRTPHSSWKILWPEDNNLYLLTSPSAYLDGFLYKINLASGNFTKTLGPKPGLLASLNGANWFISEADTDNKTVISSLAIKTLPEKCAWSKKSKDVILCGVPLSLPAGIYPDDWYKGKISFDDVIIKMNLSGGSASSVLIPENADVINPVLSEDETLLFFINKKDGTLWRVKLE
ncbi:MAG: hypothetical protein AAB730_00435 [Patescibacteria group bacterium]